jgi:hypothetical protein
MMWSGCQPSRFDRAGLVDGRCLTSWVFVHARSFMRGRPQQATQKIRSKHHIFKRPHLISAIESHRPSHHRLLKLPTKITKILDLRLPPQRSRSRAQASETKRVQARERYAEVQPGVSKLKRLIFLQ